MALFQIFGEIWKNDSFLDIFLYFLPLQFCKWGRDDLKFSESLLFSKF